MKGRDRVGPFLTIGETVVVRWTVPLNPLAPVMIMAKTADELRFIVWLVGVAVMVKLGAGVTVTDTVVPWDIDPPVAVTVTA